MASRAIGSFRLPSCSRCAHVLRLVIPAGRRVTVAAALFHVVSPQQEELLITVVSHTLIPLTASEKGVRYSLFWRCFTYLHARIPSLTLYNRRCWFPL